MFQKDFYIAEETMFSWYKSCSLNIGEIYDHSCGPQMHNFLTTLTTFLKSREVILSTIFHNEGNFECKTVGKHRKVSEDNEWWEKMYADWPLIPNDLINNLKY